MGPGLPKLQVGTAEWRWLGLYLASIGGALGSPCVGEPEVPSRGVFQVEVAFGTLREGAGGSEGRKLQGGGATGR